MAADLATIDPRALALGLLEAAPDAILVVREGGAIALANRMAEKLFGYDRAELLGQPVEMLVPTEARERHVHHRERYDAAPRPRPMGDLEPLVGIRKNGEPVPIEISLSPVQTPIGRLTIAIVRDVSRRRELEAQLRFASTHDSLTGLYNRTFLDEMRQSLEAEGTRSGVILVDVDGLKAVNDRLGHEAGDLLLKRCALVLRSAAGPDSRVARLGGDEFAVLIPHADAPILETAVERLRDEVERHNELNRGPPLSISIGAALTERRGGIAQAMRLADHRMYDDKRNRGMLRTR